MADRDDVADLAVRHAQQLLSGQFRDDAAIDAKALGLLGADAAVVAVIVATHQDLNDLWWLPGIGLIAAAILLLVTVWPRELDAGPDPRIFFEMFGGATLLDANLQMLAEVLDALDRNRASARYKFRVFRAALWVLAVSVAGTIAVVLTR